jgi:hypothetical protein
MDVAAEDTHYKALLQPFADGASVVDRLTKGRLGWQKTQNYMLMREGV